MTLQDQRAAHGVVSVRDINHNNNASACFMRACVSVVVVRGKYAELLRVVGKSCSVFLQAHRRKEKFHG